MCFCVHVMLWYVMCHFLRTPATYRCCDIRLLWNLYLVSCVYLFYQMLMEMEATLPNERDPTGTFTPLNLAAELKVQV